MKIHDLKPAAGLEPAPQARRPRHRRQGRQDRRPRHQGPEARGTVPAGFEGGQMPLHMRVPKLKGFNNPFRVEYQAHQPRHPRGVAGSTRSRPSTLHAQGPRPQGRPGQGPRPGRAHPAGHGARPTPSRSRPRQPSPRPAVRLRSCRCRGATGVRRPRATSSPTADRPPAAPAAAADQEHSPCSSSLQNMFKVPDLRNKILFTLLIIALYRLGCARPGARASTSTPSRSCKRQAEAAAACSASSQLFSGGALTQFAVFALGIMPYITARSSCRSSRW